MAEYIEREAAIAKCREVAACEWNHRASPVSWADAYEQFAEDVEALPSADVAPVRHGRWVKIYENGEPAIEQHQVGVFCSRCMKMPKDRFTESDFCPNCGCKMDLEG